MNDDESKEQPRVNSLLRSQTKANNRQSNRMMRPLIVINQPRNQKNSLLRKPIKR